MRVVRIKHADCACNPRTLICSGPIAHCASHNARIMCTVRCRSSMDGFGVSVCIHHGDRSRRRVLAVIAGSEIACCDVTVEGHDTENDAVGCRASACYHHVSAHVCLPCASTDVCCRYFAVRTAAVRRGSKCLGWRWKFADSRWIATSRFQSVDKCANSLGVFRVVCTGRLPYCATAE